MCKKVQSEEESVSNHFWQPPNRITEPSGALLLELIQDNIGFIRFHQLHINSIFYEAIPNITISVQSGRRKTQQTSADSTILQLGFYSSTQAPFSCFWSHPLYRLFALMRRFLFFWATTTTERKHEEVKDVFRTALHNGTADRELINSVFWRFCLPTPCR